MGILCIVTFILLFADGYRSAPRILKEWAEECIRMLNLGPLIYQPIYLAIHHKGLGQTLNGKMHWG